MAGDVTDGVEQWIINLPVWFQTPLVLAVLLPVSFVVARVVLWAVTKAVAPDAGEQAFFGSQDSGPDSARDNASDSGRDSDSEGDRQ